MRLRSDFLASARQLRRALAETAFPATLLYARRVQGHARVCFELHRVLEAEAQAEELCGMAIRTPSAQPSDG